MVSWTLLAVVFTLLTAHTALALPAPIVKDQGHNHNLLSTKHRMAARGEQPGGAFAHLGSAPRMGLQTGSEKINSTSSASRGAKPSGTMVLDKILNDVGLGKVDVHGTLDFEHVPSGHAKTASTSGSSAATHTTAPVYHTSSASAPAQRTSQSSTPANQTTYGSANRTPITFRATSTSSPSHAATPTSTPSNHTSSAPAQHTSSASTRNAAVESNDSFPSVGTAATSKNSPALNGARNTAVKPGNASTAGATARNSMAKLMGGFYRIDLNGNSQPLSASSDSSSSSSSDGARVAAVSGASEPSGNLPNQSVITNNPSYGFLEAQDDLYAIRKWAGDLNRLASKNNRNETIMALFNAATRYYPDVDTKKVVRIMLADIKAESDFITNQKSGARLDSGASYGLLQVSPTQSSQELKLFKKAAQYKSNTYSWTVGLASDVDVKSGGQSTLGPLRDFKTGKQIDMMNLSSKDLERPWINIHIAMWLQSNYARTGSQDPSTWDMVSSASKSVRSAYQPAMQTIIGSDSSSNSNANSTSSGGNSTASSSASSSANSRANSGSSSNYDAKTYQSKLSSLNQKLKGKHTQKVSFATGLGSWVAGAAADGSGYNRNGDDISAKYFSHISEGIAVMYTGSVKNKNKYGKNWLDQIELVPGLVDYSN